MLQLGTVEKSNEVIYSPIFMRRRRRRRRRRSCVF
jgi:hypothetical protein